ncbi:MAG: hypothetical protein QXI43_00195 [Candidatus Nitrosocaldus sp.]
MEIVLRGKEGKVKEFASRFDVTIYNLTLAPLKFANAKIMLTTRMLIIEPFEHALIELPLQNIRAYQFESKKRFVWSKLAYRRYYQIVIKYYNINKTLSTMIITTTTTTTATTARKEASSSSSSSSDSDIVELLHYLKAIKVD